MLMATKTVRFDAAHLLTGHSGLCRNLHGHTYRVDVSVCRESPSPDDMVIDFKELKDVVSEVVVSRFDHSFICDVSSPAECEIAEAAERHGMRVARVGFRSTAENLARHFFGKLSRRLPGIASVKVWETPDSCAEFKCGD